MSSLLINRGIDVTNATWYASGDVGVELYNEATKFITLCHDADQLTVVLSTYGGDFYYGLGIYDMLNFLEKPVKILCAGPVMSAGMIILQAATERVALPNTQFMIHYGEDSSTAADDLKHSESMLELMKRIVSGRVKVKRRTINNWFNKDTYFTAQQAMKVGLIDRISK